LRKITFKKKSKEISIISKMKMSKKIVSGVHFLKLTLYHKLFQGFSVFEVRKNLDLRKISGVTNISFKSKFDSNLK
jgi:hypothetical protein